MYTSIFSKMSDKQSPLSQLKPARVHTWEALKEQSWNEM